MTWTYQPHRLAKPRPRALDKRDRQKAEDALYRKASAAAKKRDGGRCRCCGSDRAVESHHVERRSSFGTKYVEAKHSRRNLLTLCGGPEGCHTLEKGKVLKVVVHDDEQGTDGFVTIFKWSDAHRDFLVFRKRA